MMRRVVVFTVAAAVVSVVGYVVGGIAALVLAMDHMRQLEREREGLL